MFDASGPSSPVVSSLVMPPAGSSHIAASSAGEDPDLECQICMEDLGDIAVTCVYACDRCASGGTFHTKCIKGWCSDLRSSSAVKINVHARRGHSRAAFRGVHHYAAGSQLLFITRTVRTVQLTRELRRTI
jgi:hypothetical protein